MVLLQTLLLLSVVGMILIIGSCWYCKEKEEIGIKEAVHRLGINKAKSSGFWGWELIAKSCAASDTRGRSTIKALNLLLWRDVNINLQGSLSCAKPFITLTVLRQMMFHAHLHFLFTSWVVHFSICNVPCIIA